MNRRFFLNLSAAAGAAVISTPAFAGGHGRLATFTGASNHVTTGRVEIAKKNGEYAEVLIWCEKYNVPLGVAKF